jgi:hypothetical protein
MIAQRHRQAQMLARLREVRLESANRALIEARRAAEEAEIQRRAAEEKALTADAQLDAHRSDLVQAPVDPPAQIALIERSLFLQAVARSAASDAAEALRQCEEAERARRRAMVLARARHDLMQDQARSLSQRRAAAHEEQAESETEDRRRA